jgi:hypothetical protein
MQTFKYYSIAGLRIAYVMTLPGVSEDISMYDTQLSMYPREYAVSLKMPLHVHCIDIDLFLKTLSSGNGKEE